MPTAPTAEESKGALFTENGGSRTNCAVFLIITGFQPGVGSELLPCSIRANAHCWFQLTSVNTIIMGFSNRPAFETVASDYARRLVRYRTLAHGAPGANYFSRNSTSLGVFRFADEVAQRLNIAELVSEKLL